MMEIRSREQYRALQAETIACILAECLPEDSELSFDMLDGVVADLPKANEALLDLVEVVKDPQGTRDRVSQNTSGDLALEYDGACALLNALETIPSPLGAFLAPHLVGLRDACLITATRRGVLLATGNDPLVRYWAHLTAALLLSMTMLSGLVRKGPTDPGPV